jgi:hypothetical protein
MKTVKILAHEEISEIILRKKRGGREEKGNRLLNWNIFFENRLHVISDSY